MSRYTGRQERINNPEAGTAEEIYQELIEKRNIKKITQYITPTFPELTPERRRSIDFDSYIWKRGDRLYKLAHQYYGDAKLWYLIAWFNQTPTDSHINLGDTIMVPISYERVLTYFNKF